MPIFSQQHVSNGCNGGKPICDASGRITAQEVQVALDQIHCQLQTSGAPRLLCGIDICNTQLSTTAVGIFSIHESRLQSEYGWSAPFDEVIKILSGNGFTAEATAFEDYRLAINVLKHGIGSSHKKLFAKAANLPFKVRGTANDLQDEGDVCPPSDLIVMSATFLEQCCDIAETSYAVVKSLVARSQSVP